MSAGLAASTVTPGMIAPDVTNGAGDAAALTQGDDREHGDAGERDEADPNGRANHDPSSATRTVTAAPAMSGQM